MKKEELVVRCMYGDYSKPVVQVLRESFCLFLQKELEVFAMEPESRV